MNRHPLYEKIVDSLIKSDPRPDLPSPDVRRETIYAFLERDSDDGRHTIEIPRGDMGESIEATFDSMSLGDESLEDL